MATVKGMTTSTVTILMVVARADVKLAGQVQPAIKCILRMRNINRF